MPTAPRPLTEEEERIIGRWSGPGPRPAPIAFLFALRAAWRAHQAAAAAPKDRRAHAQSMLQAALSLLDHAERAATPGTPEASAYAQAASTWATPTAYDLMFEDRYRQGEHPEPTRDERLRALLGASGIDSPRRCR